MFRYVVCFILFFTPLLVSAGEGDKRLQAFFSSVTAVRADFTQQVLGANSETLQETRGQMLLLRPGRFRWDYKKPYEQQIVSDGKKVWLYDVDLEQVTIQSVDSLLGSAPALLLSSDKPLHETFNTRELGAEQNLQWVELTPKQEEAGFEKLILGFDADNLVSMELQDSFGQLTRLKFNEIERNPVIDPALFEFVAPPGVDVIGE